MGGTILRRTSVAIAVALATLGGGITAAAEFDIEKLAWLAGCWKSESAETGSGEIWTPLAGGTMLGMSRTVRKNTTIEFEFMELRHLPDGVLAFIAHPRGQRTTTFPLSRISASEAIFENPAHDFPQRIAYARDGDAKLRARIEGMSHGKLRVIEFPMTRVSCDAQLGGPDKKRDAAQPSA